MGANRPRVEVHFSRKNRERILKLKQEVRLRTGKFVSMSRLVDEIVGEFFERQEISLAIPDRIDNSNSGK